MSLQELKQLFCWHRYEYIGRHKEAIDKKVWIEYYRCAKCGKEKVKWEPVQTQVTEESEDGNVD